MGDETRKFVVTCAAGNGAILRALEELLGRFGPVLLQIIEAYLAAHDPKPAKAVGDETRKLIVMCATGNGAILRAFEELLGRFGPVLLQIIEAYLAGHGLGPIVPPQGN